MLTARLRQQLLFVFFLLFLPCNFLWNDSLLIGAKASQISSVEIRYCLSSTAKPRSTPKLWLPFHNIVIIWQLSGLCASEVGSKTIHPDVFSRGGGWYGTTIIQWSMPYRPQTNNADHLRPHGHKLKTNGLRVPLWPNNCQSKAPLQDLVTRQPL